MPALHRDDPYGGYYFDVVIKGGSDAGHALELQARVAVQVDRTWAERQEQRDRTRDPRDLPRRSGDRRAIMSTQLPGVFLSVVPRPEPPSPLRTDVAAFAGRTRRGPPG